jgi:NAD(P)-dependent dehydrogenase (short-subunit alcohol dehydrogenase family)
MAHKARTRQFPVPVRHRKSGQPDIEKTMSPKPVSSDPSYRPAGKLMGKVALVTGGDSGIGRAVSIAFAKEGADVAIIYLHNTQDARETRRQVEAHGRQCLTLRGDAGLERFCREAVAKTLRAFRRLDVLVNNAGEHQPEERPENISRAKLERVFRTNIFSYFYLTAAALPHLKEGSTIINTTSVTAYRGSPHLIDYSSTKGAIVSFTRSLSKNVVERGIRVNGVAPGPVWTPLIRSSFPKARVRRFGKGTPMGRPGQPQEIAPCFVFLASDDSSYMTGQVLHPNGGEVING